VILVKRWTLPLCYIGIRVAVVGLETLWLAVEVSRLLVVARVVLEGHGLIIWHKLLLWHPLGVGLIACERIMALIKGAVRKALAESFTNQIAAVLLSAQHGTSVRDLLGLQHALGFQEFLELVVVDHDHLFSVGFREALLAVGSVGLSARCIFIAEISRVFQVVNLVKEAEVALDVKGWDFKFLYRHVLVKSGQKEAWLF